MIVTAFGKDLQEISSKSETLMYPSIQKMKGLVNFQRTQTTSVPTNYLSFLETSVSFQSAANIENNSEETNASAERDSNLDSGFT